ncbi:hypothetical protein AAES_44682 [Amazona aestiva]|uniref:FYVE-type zinc finger domain-containing protein n=1 Tax=Amazona aestiva TaxID=12930 RepID=A0A0Q3PUN7_AMAAE|nr:hypothetical protein AAES_44682 [Amazona aestiva]
MEKGQRLLPGFFNLKQSEMKQKLDEEGNKCSILSKQQKFNEHCCIRCCAPFTFLINSKRQCQDCKYNICKSCSSYQKKEKAWICSVCQQARLFLMIFLQKRNYQSSQRNNCRLLQVVNILLVYCCTRAAFTLGKMRPVELVSQGMTLREIPVLQQLFFIFKAEIYIDIQQRPNTHVSI